MDKFDFKKAIKNNIAASQEEKKRYTLNEARITRNIVANNLSLVESLSLLSEEEILMEQILAEGEEILSEDFDLLNEGLWSKIKKFAANVIKKDKYSSTPEERERMEAQYQKMMEKTAQGLLKKFMDKFRKTYPEFPNMEDQNKFGEALVDLATFYDSIKHITLTPKDVQNQPISIVQKEIEDGKLDPKLANEIIGDLRAVMMKFIDYDLAPMYKQTNEQMNEEEEENLLNRAQGGDSKSMQNQKSLKLPAILGLIGGLSALGGILVNAGWFSGLFQQVVDNPSVETVKETGKVITKTLSPQPGEGFTQMMGRIFLGDPDALGPNATVGDLLKVMKENGVSPEKLAEISDKGKELFLKDWESTIANADPNATLGDTLGPNGLGVGGNLGLALGKKAVVQIVQGAAKAVLAKVGGAQAAGALGALGITAPAAATALGILGAGLASVGLVSYAMRKKAQKSSRLQKLQDLRNEMEDLKVPEVLEPVTDPEVKPKVPAADDIKMGDWVRYTNDKGQKMLVRISNRMDLNPTELQEADRPAKWGGRFQADVMINLDTGRVSFSGPYALETKDAEKAEDAFVEKTKASNPKIQRAIDRVEARKSKEDAEKPSDEEGEEQGDATAQLVDANTDLIARYLLKPEKEAAGKIKMIFKPFFEKAGIPWKGGEAVNNLLSLMRQVATNRKIRSRMTSMTNKKNESKKIINKIIKESLRAYINKEILRENLYNSKYPSDDKVRVVLNEGKTLLIEREIHEGIMDLLKGFTKSKPGWKKELEKQIDTWLAKSKLDDGAKASLKKYYMKNLENLPAEFYKDEQNLKQVEDSLSAAEAGDANKAKEELDDAAKSAEDGSGEDLKAQGGDLVIVTSGDNQLLLRIAGGGETRQSEPESRRGSLGSRARSRANRRFGSGGMKLGSGYSGSLGESILRLNEKEYKIDAGILLKTGAKYLPKKAVDLTVNNARIATDEEIEQIKKKYPEQFEKFFGSQGKSSEKLKDDSATAQFVDANTDLIARYLLKPDKDATGKIKMIFKPFFEEAGIPWKGGEAVNDLLNLMRQVATNRKIRSRMTSMTNKKNESKKFTNKIIKESLRAYIKNEIKK